MTVILKKNNIIIWLTGLSGTGKTTLSKYLSQKFKSNNLTSLLVDGDKFRKKNNINNRFNKSNITLNNLAIINFIKNLKKNYDIILVSVISPLRATRSVAKNNFKGRYFEVYVKCSKKTLIKRDTKGLYKLALKKKIKNLIGFNSKIKYERSSYKTIIIDTDKLSIQESVKKILIEIKKTQLFKSLKISY